MHEDKIMRALHRHAKTATAFETWLTDGEELCDAVNLLGGERWHQIARNVVARVRDGSAAYTQIDRLRALKRLLHLHHADDLGSEEAARFAAIHPDDPRADEARRCAEALDRGIAALCALQAISQPSRQEAA